MQVRSTTSTAISATAPIESGKSTAAIEFSDHLPLQFIKSETIPPAPTRSESTIDWLPEFAGYSWIAYGASSLLVISHLPSPLSDEEVAIGPIFRQAIELSIDGPASVSAVSWSPATPSTGDLAVAYGSCIGLFSYNSETSQGSFCWTQSAILKQSTKVNAIKWTDSGDGIISGGVDVVLWRKKGRSWEIAWKFRTELPQALVSATWSIEGPSATAPQCHPHYEGISSLINDASKYVIVCISDGRSGHVKTELHHPLPISMIQWRPSNISKSRKNTWSSLRHVLLTCCLDGTVRLWCEIDEGRGRRYGNDGNDQKPRKPSFCVVAVIEISQAIHGTLGSDTYVRWATEIDNIVSAGKGANQYFFPEGNQHDMAGRCEWLIGFGPQMLVTFWAIHHLDDVSPMRFPRVTLWKRQELVGSKVGTNTLVLSKVVILRNRICGPPAICSLVQLLPCNSLSLSQLYIQPSANKEDVNLTESSRDNLLLHCANEVVNIDGHSGNFLQIAVHPCRYEVELAVSLDSAGSFLLWSFNTIPTPVMGLPTFNPSWKISGKFVPKDSCCKYTSLCWAPFLLGEDCVLLMGHIGGIDCFVVKLSKSKEERMSFQKICTIPFGGRGHGEGLTKIFSIPLPFTCKRTSSCNSFMLLAVWKQKFQALSWEINMHSYESSGSCCGCTFEGKSTDKNELTLESSIYGKRYCVTVHPCSSALPDPHSNDLVTSFAVLSPRNFFSFKGQEWDSVHGSCVYSKYHMVTGCANGNLKLWRSLLAKSSDSDSQWEWELVGMLAVGKDPIIAISLSDCGRKIATVCQQSNSDTSNIHIWESAKLIGGGCFILEDTFSVDGDVVSLNWLTSGNAQILLGVCLQNVLQVYAQISNHETLMKRDKPLKRNIWSCIACAHTYTAILDLIWGPRATVVVVHDDCFGIFNQFLFLADQRHQANIHSKISKDNLVGYNCGSDKHIAVFADSCICDSKETSKHDINDQFQIKLPIQTNVRSSIVPSILANSQPQYNSIVFCNFRSVLDLVEKLHGALREYHPEALLLNISSGCWKRAVIALRHLAEYLTFIASAKGDCSTKSNHVIPAVPLSNYIEGIISTSTSDKMFLWSGDTPSVDFSLKLQKGSTEFAYGSEPSVSKNALMPSSTKSELCDFVETLEKLYQLAAITNGEKMQLVAIVDLLCEVIDQQSAYQSLDEPGRRFWVRIRFRQLYFTRRLGRSPAVGEVIVESGLVPWAFHSDCQENLFNSLFPNEPSWPEMRSMGFGFWFTNATQLRMKMEKLARHQYLKSKDPKACALLYIALNRLQVLTGLFKISKDEKDKPLVGFLSRNFQEDKNKAAALKNAYVLMGRHQLELAIAFFLLGGDTSSAVLVCAKNLGDEQLALVICHLVEGFGGSLERDLISKFLLPSAVEKGDYWLASYLEWMLGNHLQSFLSMMGVQMDSLISKSALSSNHDSFLDPNIGQYCIMLANRNSMRNAVGEQNAAILGRWAILMSAAALNKWGLPLEALECYSSTLVTSGNSEQGNVSDIASDGLLDIILKPTSQNFTNWASGGVSSHMEMHAKEDFAMQYISKLLREHPSWPDDEMKSFGDCSENDIHQYHILLRNFQKKFTTGLAYFEQKFSIIPLHLVNMSVSYLCNNGLVFIGYHVLQAYMSRDLSHEKRNTIDCISMYPWVPKLLLKTTEEISFLLSRYISASNITCSVLKSCSAENNMTDEKGFEWMTAWGFYMQSVMSSLQSLRTSFKLFFNSCEDSLSVLLSILDLFGFYVYFASTWIQRNFKGLIPFVRPLAVITFTGEHAPYETDMADLEKLLHQMPMLLRGSFLIDDLGGPVEDSKFLLPENGGDIMSSIPEDERWQIIGASLWGHISGFLKQCLKLLMEKLEASSESQDNCMKLQVAAVSDVLLELLETTCTHVCSYRAKQLALLLQRKVDEGLKTPTVSWLEEFSQPKSRALHKHLSQDMSSLDIMDRGNELSAVEILWIISTDPNIVLGCFARESFTLSGYVKQKSFQGWSDTYKCIMRESEDGETCNQEIGPGSKLASSGAGLSAGNLSPSGHSFPSSGGKDANRNKEVPFRTPKEIYKRNGELLEALCINSIDQHHAALAGHRKGIIYFNWESGLPSMDQSDYIWAEADWPQNGWAAPESTAVPTSPLPGVGLGSKKGADLGSGGATVGSNSLARPGRDLTGGGAFGIPGYAGIGASGLGWDIRRDFEDLVVSTATAESISTRAFSNHPSRPFFLVGSTNAHVYLWEFGKDKPLTTYGEILAANAPPPYSHSSISAVEFDHCGHRFASAALDGTICTWQLEVGGRSNVCPTESSQCFNGNAMDVEYVTSSGSIIATCGNNSNGVNVLIWDTLAPLSTSQASIMCHEGGARSLSVFDNDIGSGSISPLIVTGGMGGDVGLHDFRYIATGRIKRHRHEQSINASLSENPQNIIGEQNTNGMLWYLPKAHLGSVTKICTIPHTSFFLTGSKDGDVKLWDAKGSKLVHHWSKLHEKHTFLQPSSRSGFGGVVRAAVTDIQVVSHGFLTCGGDGCVKLVQIKDLF